MDNKFPLFPRFPPEIRQTIWRFALAQCWSFTGLQRRDRRVKLNRRVKLVGVVHRAVTQACREAHAVMRNMHTNIDALGWIDFSHHLFFFRDAKFDSSLMQRVAARHGLLAHIQHMVLNPRSWPQLWYTVDIMKSCCTSLCTLVIVAPWFKPPPADATYKEIDLAPYEDWSQLFCQTPTEINVVPLLEAIERRSAANAVWIAQYRAKLDQVVRRLPDNMPEWENTYGRTRAVLQKLEKAVQGFPDRIPTLYLRTRDELYVRPYVHPCHTSGPLD
jgi:hypothetical protein